MKKVVMVLIASLLVLSTESKADLFVPESMYTWKYEGGCLLLNYEYGNPETSFFYIANKDDSETMLLLDNTRMGNTITISKVDETYSVSDQFGATPITLGEQPEFIFKFSVNGTDFSYLYSLIPADAAGQRYTLANSATGAAIGLRCSSGVPTVNEVPVPGAAFLLGSGLLGLIGIRRRRK